MKQMRMSYLNASFGFSCLHYCLFDEVISYTDLLCLTKQLLTSISQKHLEHLLLKALKMQANDFLSNYSQLITFMY